MAKKRFTDNFESLFGDPMDDLQSQQERDPVSEPRAKDGTDDAGSDKKKMSGKDFTDSLQSFLSETFEESFERQMAEANQQPAPVPKKPRRRRSSLDMLIRNTVEPSKIEVEGEAPKRRRITLTFEPQKLEKLRHIARVERAMLKDIINEIVGEYIQKYEIEKEDPE